MHFISSDSASQKKKREEGEGNEIFTPRQNEELFFCFMFLLVHLSGFGLGTRSLLRLAAFV